MTLNFGFVTVRLVRYMLNKKLKANNITYNEKKRRLS